MMPIGKVGLTYKNKTLPIPRPVFGMPSKGKAQKRKEREKLLD